MRAELDMIVIASSVRLEDSGLERERVRLLNAILEASREVCGATQAWVAQLLSEHRGSHTAWDLGATG